MALAHQSHDPTLLYVVPAFVGLGAPHGDRATRGEIVRITRGTTRADIVLATLDSIAYQVHEVIESVARDVGKPIGKLRVDGGASANDDLMQFQSDISWRQVVRPRIAETTAIAADCWPDSRTGSGGQPAM